MDSGSVESLHYPTNETQLLTVSAAWRTAAEAGAIRAKILLSCFQK